MNQLAAAFCLLFTLACSSPTSPTQASATGLVVPAELQRVFAVLDADPWIHPLLGQPMGQYVRRYTKQIKLDPTVKAPFVAFAYPGYGGVIGWQMYDPTAFTDPDVPLSAAYLLHEVRHLEGYAHTCGNFDRTMEEGGPYAVQIIYLDHAGYGKAADALRASSIGCR